MNDIDLLMAHVDEINLKGADELTADDIDTLITYHRHQRSRKAAGEKPKKPTVDLSSIMGARKALAPKGPSIPVRRL